MFNGNLFNDKPVAQQNDRAHRHPSAIATSPSPAGPTPPALLTTKLRPPDSRLSRVPRPYLVGRLERSSDHTLTLVSAPAGSGKTTLLGDWVRTTARAVAWLSLDPADNDPTRFWTYVIEALRKPCPSVGGRALNALRSPQPAPAETIWEILLDDLAGAAQQVVLVLEDYHLIEQEAIHEGVALLLEHAPPPLHLVIVSRSDPPLPLARWRARGELAELRAPALLFNHQEVDTFCHRVMGLSLIYRAFDITPGDAMFLPPDERIVVW